MGGQTLGAAGGMGLDIDVKKPRSADFFEEFEGLGAQIEGHFPVSEDEIARTGRRIGGNGGHGGGYGLWRRFGGDLVAEGLRFEPIF